MKPREHRVSWNQEYKSENVKRKNALKKTKNRTDVSVVGVLSVLVTECFYSGRTALNWIIGSKCILELMTLQY